MYRWKYITEKDGKASEYKAYEEEAISMCQKIAYKFINEYYS